MATPNEIGGYDYDFVDTPHDRYTCKICHLPSRDPHLSECCGHLFCKTSLDNIHRAPAITNACPICHDEEPDIKHFVIKQLTAKLKGFIFIALIGRKVVSGRVN